MTSVCTEYFDCPLFGLASKNHGRTKETTIIVCGGGGSVKSGVPNLLLICTVSLDDLGRPVIKTKHKINTDMDFLSSVSLDDKFSNLAAAVYGEAVLYSIDTARGLLRRITGVKGDYSEEEAVVNNVSMTRARTSLAVAGEDGSMRLFSSAESKHNEYSLKRQMEFPSAVACTQFSPDETMVAVLCEDDVCRLVNIRTGKVVTLPGIGNRKFKGKMSFRRSMDPKLRKRGCGDWRCKSLTFSADSGTVYTLESSRHGASALVRWNVTKALEGTAKGPPHPDAYALASLEPASVVSLSPDGSRLAVGGSGQVRVFSSTSLSCVFTKTLGEAPITAVDFAAGKSVVVAATGDGCVRAVAVREVYEVSTTAYFVLATLGVILSYLVLFAI